METGALLHAPSGPELAGWKARKALVGLALLVAAALGTFVGIKGMDGGGSGGDGTVLVTLVTIGASVAIGYFGLRYLMIGVKGKGVKFFEAAVEADFIKGPGIVPRRRMVPLLHIRVSGSSRLTFAQAITTTGHAFRLPPVLVEESDLWYLGSLGTRPLAPGGREAKEQYERGDLSPYEHPSSDPLPDHGPAWPDPGTLPITVDVPVEIEVATPVEAPAPPREPPGRISTDRAPPAPTPQAPTLPAPTPQALTPPAPMPPAPVAVDPPRRPVPPAATAAPPISPPGAEMEVVMDLPDVVTPPETPRVRLPPPPMVRPASISVREPPAHRPMDRDEPPGSPEPPEPPPEPPPEAPPETPPGPEATPVAGPGPSPPAKDEWELEELPPPEGERKGKPPSSTWDWEEI